MAIPSKPSPLGPRTAAGFRPATSASDPVIARVRRQHKTRMAKTLETRPWLKGTSFQTRPMFRVRENFCLLSTAFYWKNMEGLVMCEELSSINKYFLEPMASVITDRDYRKIIKKPMDLGTMKKKWDDGKYWGNSYAILKDFNRMIDNAVAYYPRGHRIHIAAKKLHEIYESECTWENWSKWMNKTVTVAHKFGFEN